MFELKLSGIQHISFTYIFFVNMKPVFECKITFWIYVFMLSTHKGWYVNITFWYANNIYTSEILNIAHTISIWYSLPANTNTTGYCVPKHRF